MSAFATYRTFTDPEEAEALASILDHHGIPYRIDRARAVVDMTFSSDMTHERLLIFVPPDLFAEADKAQEAAIPDEPDGSFGEHYFADYGSDELLEVLHKAHEWNPGDVLIARRLLAARGVEVDTEKIAEKQQEEIAAVHKPVKGPAFLVAAGFAFAVLGGLLGFAFGWSFATMKSRDPSGKEYYHYDERTRDLGQWMLIISAISVVGWFIRFRYF